MYHDVRFDSDDEGADRSVSVAKSDNELCSKLTHLTWKTRTCCIIVRSRRNQVGHQVCSWRLHILVRSSSLMIGERTTMQQKPACLLYLFLLLQSRTAKMHVKYCASQTDGKSCWAQLTRLADVLEFLMAYFLHTTNQLHHCSDQSLVVLSYSS